MARVLVVDDDPQLLRALAINLRARRYDVATAPDAAAALATAARWRPEAVILDLGLPDMDGTEVIAGLRGWTQVPVIVLSARSDAAEKVDALDAGADDYVTKPFSMDELLARLRVALRRQDTPGDVPGPTVVHLGDVEVDLAARTAVRRRDGAAERVRLTPTEWGVLSLLLRNPGRLVGARQLLADVWGPNYQTETHYLRFYLARLRRKLEPDPAHPRYLITEPGMGYRYEPDPADPAS